MEQTEKKELQGTLSILIGVVIVGYNIYPFYSMIISFDLGFLISYTIILDFLISGIASILIGIFILRPRKATQGKKRLGIASNIFGAVILILPIIGIISAVIVTEGHSFIFFILTTIAPFLAVFLIFGTVLIIHGIRLTRKSKKERRKRKLRNMEQKQKKILIGWVSILSGVAIVIFHIFLLLLVGCQRHI